MTTLIEPLPAALDAALKADGADLVVAVATDLTPDGKFGEEWLVITDPSVDVPDGAVLELLACMESTRADVVLPLLDRLARVVERARG